MTGFIQQAQLSNTLNIKASNTKSPTIPHEASRNPLWTDNLHNWKQCWPDFRSTHTDGSQAQGVSVAVKQPVCWTLIKSKRFTRQALTPKMLQIHDRSHLTLTKTQPHAKLLGEEAPVATAYLGKPDFLTSSFSIKITLLPLWFFICASIKVTSFLCLVFLFFSFCFQILCLINGLVSYVLQARLCLH